MALYDPVRDGFREFNRMLVDSQQWDEQHAARAADRAYKDTVLQSNLVQREFENQMAGKRHQLAVNGDNRAAAQLELAVADQSFRHGIANEQLNISKTNQQMTAKELAMKKEKHVFDMQVVSAQAEKLTRPYTPTDVDLNGLVPDHLRDDDGFMSELNSLTGTMGEAYVEKDLKVRQLGEDGQGVVMQLKPVDAQKFVPAIQGLIAKYNDPNLNAKSNIEKLVEQQNAMKKMASGSDNYNLTERAAAKRQVKKIEQEIRGQYETFKPSIARDQYMQRSQQMAASAQWYIGNGMEDQAAVMQKQALELWDKAIASDAAGKGTMIQAYKEGLAKDGTAVGAGKMTYNTVTEEYTYPATLVDPKADPEAMVTTTMKPPGITFVKPTEFVGMTKATGGGDDAGTKGAMTDAQMLNIAPMYQTEGIAAMVSSNAAKAKIKTIENMIIQYHRGALKGSDTERAVARQAMVAEVEEQETDYWSTMTEIKDMPDAVLAFAVDNAKLEYTKAITEAQADKRPQRVAFLQRKLAALNKVKKTSDAREQLREHLFFRFEGDMRAVVGDPNMVVFRPNETTRKMQEGRD